MRLVSSILFQPSLTSCDCNFFSRSSVCDRFSLASFTRDYDSNTESNQASESHGRLGY